MKQEFIRAIAVLAAAGLGVFPGCGPRAGAPSAQPLVTIDSTAAGDLAIVEMHDGEAVVDVQSAKGIGGTTLRFPLEARPRALRLRFHLQGLEELRCEDGTTVVRCALPSSAPYQSRCTARRPGEPREREIGPGDPYYLQARLEAAPGAPDSIPLRDGFIEVKVPPALLQNVSLVVRWIDFYR